jgi:nucleoside phosphorylase
MHASEIHVVQSEARFRRRRAHLAQKLVTNAGRPSARYGHCVLVIAATGRELDGAGDNVETLVCGIGPVEAAVATARALAGSSPDGVLHVGIAGARGFTEPELVFGSASVYCDSESRLVPSRATPDAGLLAAARSVFPEARVTTIGTSARLGGTTDCELEAMEGFAVLRACVLAGVPALEVRVTSNEIGEPDRARWRLDHAFALLCDSLPVLIEALDA